MLRAAQQLGRACSTSAAALEGPRALRGATQLSTLSGWRAFSSGDAPSDASGPSAADSPSEAAPSGGSSSTSRPSRLQTKEWRSWIDTKLDSTLGGEGGGGARMPETCWPATSPPHSCRCRHAPFCPSTALAAGGSPEEPAAAAAASPAAPPADVEQRSRRAVAIADALQAAEALPAEAAADEAAPRGPAPRGQRKAKGFDLEQQIYNIVAPSRPVVEDATLPEGVSSYGQLAMAADAPRFERGAHNIGDISPQRIHPTRLFFPEQIYAPAVRAPSPQRAAAATPGSLGSWLHASLAAAARRGPPCCAAPSLATTAPSPTHTPPHTHTHTQEHTHIHCLLPAGAGSIQGGGDGARL